MKTPKKSSKKILFILCAPRSGSTLLKNMLDQHSEIFAPAEMHILPFDDLNNFELNFRNTQIGYGLIECIIKLKKCSKEEALEIYDYFKANNYTSQDIYNWFLSDINATYLVDKSPSYGCKSNGLQNCHKLNNDIRFIHLIRHPLAAIKSVLDNNLDKLARMFTINSLRAIRSQGENASSEFLYFDREKMKGVRDRKAIAEAFWRESNYHISEFLTEVEPARKLQVHYENLVDYPVETMQEICSFLDLDYQAKMNNPAGIFSNVEETIGDPNFFTRNTIKNLNNFSLDEFMNEQSEMDSETIDLAIKYNYLCWESEKTTELLPTEASFFENTTYHNNYCLISTFESISVNQFDEQKLYKSLAELMIMNPNLSSTFVKTNLGWKRRLVGDLQIEIKRLSYKPEEDINAVLERSTKNWIDQLDISVGPLLIILYVYQNKNLTIRYILHHLLMDGYAMQQFHHQLWNRYSLEKAPPLLPIYKNEVQQYIQLCQEKKENSYQSIDGLAFYSVFELRKGAPTYAKQEEAVLLVDKSAMQLSRFNYNELSSALYKQLSKYTPGDQVTIAHRFNNRNTFGQSKKNLVAWLASDVPITLDSSQKPALLVQDFRAKKRAADQAALAFNLSNAQFDLHNHCPVRFNYFPLFLNKGEQAIQFSNYDISLSFDPRNKMDYMLDLIVREDEEQLEFVVRYPKLEFERDFILSFINEWVSILPSFSKN